jgi:hypothetical protein
MLTLGEKDEFEQLVDKHSMAEVLLALFHICHDKAEHLQSNWQDRNSAKAWKHIAKKISAAQSDAFARSA